jgi:hypothetical protein
MKTLWIKVMKELNEPNSYIIPVRFSRLYTVISPNKSEFNCLRIQERTIKDMLSMGLLIRGYVNDTNVILPNREKLKELSH